MDEKDEDKKEPTLPQGYEYIADYTNKAQQDLRDIDAKIEALPKDRQDTDAPKPFGTVRQSEASKYKSERFRFEQQKEEVKSKLNQDIGREAKHADPKDAAAINNFSNHAVKDSVYNKQAKNTEAFEKRQDDFSKLRDDAEAKREAGQPAKGNSPSRSDSLFSNTNYNVQANQVNLTQVNVSKDNVTFNTPEAAQPQQASRSDNALSKSNFVKEQNTSDKDKANNKDKQPEAEKTNDGDADKKPSRADAALGKSSFSQEQTGADKKADFSVNKAGITEPSSPGGSGGGKSKAPPSKDDR